MIYIGIDPGLDGAIAAINEQGEALGIWDVPTFTVQRAMKKKDGSPRTKRIIDRPSLWIIFEGLKLLGPLLSAGIELVGPMPDQGISSMFSMGQGFGMLQMSLTASKIPHSEVTPQSWKKAMMPGMGKDKSNSLYVARQMFPSADLAKKRHHGRAEALLIAAYMRRNSGQGDA